MDSTFMTRSLPLLALGCLLMMPGCTPKPGYTDRLTKQLEVMPAELTHVVAFHPSQTMLDEDEEQHISAFIDQIHPSQVSHVIIESDQDHPAADKRSQSITQLLHRAGWRHVPIDHAPRRASIGPLTEHDESMMQQTIVRIHYRNVNLPKCPDWAHGAGAGNMHNLPGANFGCSTVSNLGRMVANPGDLIHSPYGKAQSDGTNAMLSIHRYHSSFAAEAGSSGD